MKTLNNVDRRRYSEQVVDILKAKILCKSLAIGDKLPGEKELTAQFDVSRTVVREAIRVLEESGLVEIKKGRTGGVFVTGVLYKPVSTSLRSLADHGAISIENLLDARLLIEPHIVSLAVTNATADDLNSLQAIIDNASSHEGNAELLRRDNINFHVLLAKAAGNPVLSIIGESIIRSLDELTQEYKGQSGEEHNNLHKQLLSLIKEKRSDEVSALMTHDILMLRARRRKVDRSASIIQLH